MRIGEFAQSAGLTTRQVRFYTDAGLVPVRRLPNGYRDYDEQDVVRARRTRTLFAIGLTAEQVQGLAPCLAQEDTVFCPATKRALDAQLSDIDRRIEQLEAARTLIARRLGRADAHD